MSSACGKTTVPMSRPSITTPPSAPSARWRATSTSRTAAQDLAARDKSDSTRSVAPLAQAADAVYIDTTGVPVDDVVARVLALVHDRGGAPVSGLGARD